MEERIDYLSQALIKRVERKLRTELNLNISKYLNLITYEELLTAFPPDSIVNPNTSPQQIMKEMNLYYFLQKKEMVDIVFNKLIDNAIKDEAEKLVNKACNLIEKDYDDEGPF